MDLENHDGTFQSEDSKHLFDLVQWSDIFRSSPFQQYKDYQLLEKSHSNIALVLDNPMEAKDLADLLLKILGHCTSDLTAQQYALTRCEEILGLSGNFADNETMLHFGMKNASLFTTADGAQIVETPFLRALDDADLFVQKSASLCLACLLSAPQLKGNVQSLILWITPRLSDPKNVSEWEVALPALTMLTRNQLTRFQLASKSSVLVGYIVKILEKVGVNGNAQQLYELCLILWTLTLSIEGCKPSASYGTNGSALSNFNGDADQFTYKAKKISEFLSAGAIVTLVDLISAAPSRKVTRVCFAAMRNLAATEDEKVLDEILSTGLLKLVENIVHTNALVQAGDDDLENDVKYLHALLVKNYRELSTFDRWSTEVTAGSLRWGILHSEKFWKENAKFVEGENYRLLRTLLDLLNAADPTVVSIALYDVGEFARFYPNGKVVISRLGGKDTVMNMMAHENPEIQRHALQCVSKLMVTNWEFLR